MLEIRNVSKSFGGIKALNNVSISIGKEEVIGLIGPNGSGKTTLFNIVSGLLKPDGGIITFKNRRIDGRKPEEISLYGISRTFQEMRLVETLSILENTVIASLPRFDMDYDSAISAAAKALKIVGLKDKAHIPVLNLGDGEKRLVELARAIAGEPELIMLDEIMAGLTENEQNKLAELINHLRSDMGITVFWIEHVLRAMFKLVEVDRIVVLNWGNKIAEGIPDEILNNTEVVEAYLGKIRGLGGESFA
jgi:ABC-type branched-subunit amino acid transport system ATPase component